MTADSSIRSPLLPAATPAPLEDEALDDFLQQFVVGITGMPGTLVYPRWQEEPPNLPENGVDWAAIGVAEREGDTYGAEEHEADGVTYVSRHETLDVQATFYGPNAQSNAALFRDGLMLSQNREVLFLAGMGLHDVGQLQRSGDLIKMRWLGTSELPFSVRRIIVRKYPIRDIASLDLEATVQTPTATVIYDVEESAAQPKEAVR
jgi:hypothetical protein